MAMELRHGITPYWARCSGLRLYYTYAVQTCACVGVSGKLALLRLEKRLHNTSALHNSDHVFIQQALFYAGKNFIFNKILVATFYSYKSKVRVILF